jgi:DNA processing protein
MTDFEALVSLNMLSGIGSISLARLLEFSQSPHNIFSLPREKLNLAVGEKKAEEILSFNPAHLKKELSLASSLKLKIISIFETDYPKNLKEIPGAPLIIYLKGNLIKEDNFAVAIVGSRQASFYGLSCAKKFSAALVRKGFTVVSGMARGIDTSAHKGALNEGGRTIAVLGSGFNYIYPEENKELAEDIAKQGCVISEFSLNTRPLSQNFPRRNRIISGLSLGILIVEAAKNSGALITADFALEQGREVFALPGKVDCPTSFGTNGLIKQGAKLVSCLEDIIEELSCGNFQDISSTVCNTDQKEKISERIFSQEVSLLYDMISESPVSLDSLLEKSNMQNSRVYNILLKMQLAKVIKEIPGKQFVRSS